jgi:hypothetical protein
VKRVCSFLWALFIYELISGVSRPGAAEEREADDQALVFTKKTCSNSICKNVVLKIILHYLTCLFIVFKFF